MKKLESRVLGLVAELKKRLTKKKCQREILWIIEAQGFMDLKSMNGEY